MKTLLLQSQRMKLVHANVRIEKHGEEEIVANDLKLRCETGNKILDLLDPGLRPAIYHRAGDSEHLDFDDELPDLRFPDLHNSKPLDWNLQLFDYSVAFESEIAGKTILQIDECKIGHVKFLPKPNGIVELTVTVSLCPDSDERKQFQDLLMNVMPVTFIPPADNEFGD